MMGASQIDGSYLSLSDTCWQYWMCDHLWTRISLTNFVVCVFPLVKKAITFHRQSLKVHIFCLVDRGPFTVSPPIAQGRKSRPARRCQTFDVCATFFWYFLFLFGR